MTVPGSLASRLILSGVLFASVASAAIDPQRRNETYGNMSPKSVDVKNPTDSQLKPESQRPSARTPETSTALQRRASIDVRETKPKQTRSFGVRQVETRSPLREVYARSPGVIRPASSAVPTSRVEKYQRALRPASAVKVGRMPALAPGTSVTINRFVFTKGKPVPAPTGAPRAGGRDAED